MDPSSRRPVESLKVQEVSGPTCRTSTEEPWIIVRTPVKLATRGGPAHWCATYAPQSSRVHWDRFGIRRSGWLHCLYENLPVREERVSPLVAALILKLFHDALMVLVLMSIAAQTGLGVEPPPQEVLSFSALYRAPVIAH